jgi:hypothetical protein
VEKYVMIGGLEMEVGGFVQEITKGFFKKPPLPKKGGVSSYLFEP